MTAAAVVPTSKSNEVLVLEKHTLFNFEGPERGTQGGLAWGQKQTCGYGGVAQLGEHLPCKQGVDSSILFVSTRGLAREGKAKHRWLNGNRESHRYGLIAQVVRARA